MNTIYNETLNAELKAKARRVKLLLMDCDGVLTDGRLYYSERGEELKVFNVRDGLGIVSWHRAGFVSGIISGRNSKIVNRRAEELGISFVRQSSGDKVSDFNKILADARLMPEAAAFIGDDIPDIELLKVVGFPVAVADAARELFEFTCYQTSAFGGRGAVRELIDLLLFAKKS